MSAGPAGPGRPSGGDLEDPLAATTDGGLLAILPEPILGRGLNVLEAIHFVTPYQ
jgi:hypothetical protein